MEEHSSTVSVAILDSLNEQAGRQSGMRRVGAQVVLLGAFALDMFLYTLVVPFLPAHARMLGASPALTGLIFASYAVGLFVVTPFAGWLTDSIGARRTLLGGLVALFGATLCFAYAPGLASLFVARAAQGVASGVTWTAGLALVAQMFLAHERARMFAAIFMATGVGTLLGPPLGGALFTWGGFRAPFLVAGVLILLDGLGRVLYLPGQDVLAIRPPAHGATRKVLSNRRFVNGLLATLVGASIFSALDPTLPQLLSARFHFTVLQTGFLFGCLVLVFVGVQQLVGYAVRHTNPQVLMAVGLVTSAAALAELAINKVFALEVVSLVGLACAIALVLVPSLEELTSAGHDMAHGKEGGVAYGTIYAVYNLAYGGGILLGPLYSGALVQWRGFTIGLLLVGLLPLVATLPLLPHAP